MLLDKGATIANNSGATISGGTGVFSVYGPSTIVNAGVVAGGTASTGRGVRLESGGALTNQSGGTISGYLAVLTGTVAVTLINAGTIAGSSGASGYGVYLRAGGQVTNQTGGTIAGRYAVSSRLTAATVDNAGLISGGTGTGERAVYLGKGGTLTNQAGGALTGNRGVVATGAAATIRNAGTIAGSTSAVSFGAGFAHTLIADPGAVFSGVVNGGNTIGATAASTLELTSAVSAGTLAGLGSQFVNFARFAVDTGATWALTGANTLASQTTLTNNGTLNVAGGSLAFDTLLGSGRIAASGGATIAASGTVAATETIALGTGANRLALTPSAFAGTISGFNAGETIVLTGIADAVSANISGGNTLLVHRGANPDISLLLDPAANYAGATFSVGDGASDFVTTDLPCFAKGTRIDTPEGPVAVEDLKEGGLVCLHDGGTAPIVWIGRRRVNCARHPRPERVWPVRVAAGAFGPGLPRRDLFLSPNHAIFANDVLFPIAYLIDGDGIAQVSRDEVVYFHLELPAHDVVLAEGLPAESYLDTGDRARFDNGGGAIDLHPDFSAAIWEGRGYARLVVTGPELAAVKRRVRDWALARRHGVVVGDRMARSG